MVEWDKDQLEEESEIVKDGKWKPDVEIVDDWPNEILPEPPFYTNEPLNDWLGETVIDIVWNQVIPIASSSEGLIFGPPCRYHDVFPDELWNDHA